ncbi:hypothetical protein BH24DEI1_BH24DEI1_05910 [soil metagenome]|jgi:hypothetical protein|nr:hypothetical protein [Deinococcota bacterium]
MNVDDWVLEAVSELGRGKAGASIRQVQRYIDERRHEELALDTLRASLSRWVGAGRLELEDDHYFVAKATSKEDAMRRLFSG